MTNRTFRRLRPLVRAAARMLACAPLLGAPLLGAPLALHAADTAATPVTEPASGRYIVVDTGHTPAHPGSTGASGRVEYLYNLDLSLSLIHI